MEFSENKERFFQSEFKVAEESLKRFSNRRERTNESTIVAQFTKKSPDLSRSARQRPITNYFSVFAGDADAFLANFMAKENTGA